MTLNVPIKFTVTLWGDGGLYSLANGIDLYVIGELDKKHCKFNKEQTRLLNDHITRFVEDACSQVEILLPKEVRDEFKALGKEYKTFLEEVRKAGIKLEDLD